MLNKLDKEKLPINVTKMKSRECLLKKTIMCKNGDVLHKNIYKETYTKEL